MCEYVCIYVCMYVCVCVNKATVEIRTIYTDFLVDLVYFLGHLSRFEEDPTLSTLGFPRFDLMVLKDFIVINPRGEMGLG